MIKSLQVKLIKSVIGRNQKQRACVRGLGLKRINSTVVVEDTPMNRGMIKKVDFLLEVGEKK
jgi:large subunit ribosomal protein L30